MLCQTVEVKLNAAPSLPDFYLSGWSELRLSPGKQEFEGLVFFIRTFSDP